MSFEGFKTLAALKTLATPSWLTRRTLAAMARAIIPTNAVSVVGNCATCDKGPLMTVKSTLVSLALAGFGVLTFSASGCPETVTLMPADAASAVVAAPVAADGRADTAPAAVQQSASQDVAAIAADPPESALKRVLSAIIQFGASAASR